MIAATLVIVETLWFPNDRSDRKEKSSTRNGSENNPSANILIIGANFPNMAATNQRLLLRCAILLFSLFCSEEDSEVVRCIFLLQESSISCSNVFELILGLAFANSEFFGNFFSRSSLLYLLLKLLLNLV